MLRLLLCLILFVLFAGLAYSQSCSYYNCHRLDASGKAGPHNFVKLDSKNGPTTQTVSPCAPCHKPHNAGSLVPLWNDDNKYDDGAAYTAYSSPSGTLDNAIDSTINPASEACMACHDGMSETTGYEEAYFKSYNYGMGRLEIDYAKANHPIGIAYDASKDAGLNANVTGGKVIGANGSFKLINNKVECLTCHDPHKKETFGWSWPLTTKKLLRTTDINTFCNECHIAK